MLDIHFIRENRELVLESMEKKGEKDLTVVDHLLETDQEWRELVTGLDRMRAENNRKSKEIGKRMAGGEKEQAEALIRETAAVKERIQEFEEKLRKHSARREELLLRIPNVAHESVPVGYSENENVVTGEWGDPAGEKWRKPHWELSGKEGRIDFERGVKVAGAGFPFYVGSMARLQRSLIDFFIDEAVEAGYLEIETPFFVNEDSARGTGQIPDKEEMMYVVPRDGFFAIPTAEVPVTNFHRDEILPEEQLPLRYVAYSPCWRREAGSYGKEVRGLNRLHQFNKVELVKIVHPDRSYEELESLREDAERLLRKLELPYRTLLMCTGDMGFTQSKKYDLEVWSPGQKRWLEVSSCSNFTDFQARRLQLRYRGKEDRIEMVHTLNGSGLALPRVVAALLETFQREDGRVAIPESLQSYFGAEWLWS